MYACRFSWKPRNRPVRLLFSTVDQHAAKHGGEICILTRPTKQPAPRIMPVRTCTAATTYCNTVCHSVNHAWPPYAREAATRALILLYFHRTRIRDPPPHASSPHRARGASRRAELSRMQRRVARPARRARARMVPCPCMGDAAQKRGGSPDRRTIGEPRPQIQCQRLITGSNLVPRGCPPSLLQHMTNSLIRPSPFLNLIIIIIISSSLSLSQGKNKHMQ